MENITESVVTKPYRTTRRIAHIRERKITNNNNNDQSNKNKQLQQKNQQIEKKMHS